MGQYWVIVNISKGQCLTPRLFGGGSKLLEFGPSGQGVMFALAVLLASGNGRGGGDVQEFPEVGSWAGDRIVIAGDYDEHRLHVEQFLAAISEEQRSALTEEEASGNLYEIASAVGEDISESVISGLNLAGRRRRW